MYKGTPIVVNEVDIWKDRKIYGNKNWVSPFNVLQNFTLKYSPETKKVSYNDTYDFNGFEWAMPGTPFKIEGTLDK
jgi:hypothetical protein